MARPVPMIIFDRDDTLLIDHGYMFDPGQIEWTDGAIEAIRLCRELGYRATVATNQSGVARGLFTLAQMRGFHDAMAERLAAAGVALDGFYACPHHPEGSVPAFSIPCRCRKPGPGLIEQIDRDFGIDRERSLLIGDKPRDVESARAFGIRGRLFPGGSLSAFLLGVLAEPPGLPHAPAPGCAEVPDAGCEP